MLSYCFLSGGTWVHEPSVYVDICTVQAMVQGRGSAEKTAETVEVERGRKSRGAPAPDVHVDHSITRWGDASEVG